MLRSCWESSANEDETKSTLEEPAQHDLFDFTDLTRPPLFQYNHMITVLQCFICFTMLYLFYYLVLRSHTPIYLSQKLLGSSLIEHAKRIIYPLPFVMEYKNFVTCTKRTPFVRNSFYSPLLDPLHLPTLRREERKGAGRALVF